MASLLKFSPMFWYLGAALMVPTANAMATGYDEKVFLEKNGNMKDFLERFDWLLGYT